MDPAHAASKSFREIQALAEDWVPDFDSLYNFPPAARLSMIARIEVQAGRVVETGFLPLWIGRDAVPHLLSSDDPRFGEVVDYMTAITHEAGLNAGYRIVEDRVVVAAAA